MFVVTDAVASTIRAIFTQDGELAAAIELRRLLPGITNKAMARAHVRAIAGWQPLPSVAACQIVPMRPRRRSH
jgi:hypothetical protein